jgi:hypothetical protein
MQIDYDSYTKMDIKELEKVVAHAKNILNLREQKLVNSFKNKDLNALKSALEFNVDKKIPSKAWVELNFENMKYQDLEFFNFCVNLPDYKKKDDDPFKRLSKTEQAVISSFSDEKLFNVFVNDTKYMDMIANLSSIYAVEITTPKKIIKELIDGKFLIVDNKLLNEVINTGRENFLEYFFENKTYNFTKDDYKDLYERTWSYLSDHLLDMIKNNYPEYKEITLSELVQPVETAYGKDPNYERYKKFLKIDKNSFIRALNDHSFDEYVIPHLIRAFNNLSPAEDDKFFSFVDIVIAKHPELIHLFKENKSLVTSGHFKKTYEKVTNYVEFQSDLPRNESNTNSAKIKL